MAIWAYDLVRCNGTLKVYVEVQDDWTGQITSGIREIFHKDARSYYRTQGAAHDITDEVKAFKEREEKIKKALKFYDETSYLRG